MAHANGAGGAAGLALLLLFSAGCFVDHCDSFSHGSFAKPPAQSSVLAPGRHSSSSSPRPAALSMAEASRTSAGEGARHGKKRVFIFGIGYTGFGLVRAAQEKWGDDVMLFGTCRSQGMESANKHMPTLLLFPPPPSLPLHLSPSLPVSFHSILFLLPHPPFSCAHQSHFHSGNLPRCF
jgi:hypothetical protein